MVTGDEGIRTLDLRIANATLSQLSYVPVFTHQYSRFAPVGNSVATDGSARKIEGTIQAAAAAPPPPIVMIAYGA